MMLPSTSILLAVVKATNKSPEPGGSVEIQSLFSHMSTVIDAYTDHALVDTHSRATRALSCTQLDRNRGI